MREFSLQNIKSFKKSNNIEIKPITVFVGKNSCGKSSLLRFPVVLAQTYRDSGNSPLLLFGSMLDYGSFDDVKFHHDDGTITFSLTFGPEISAALFNSPRRYNINRRILKEYKFETCRIQVEISRRQRKTNVKKISLTIGDGNSPVCFFTQNTSNGAYTFYLNYIYEDNIWSPFSMRMTVSEDIIHFNHFIPQIEEMLFRALYCKKNGIFSDNNISLFYFDASESEIALAAENSGHPELPALFHSFAIISCYFDGINYQLMRDAAELTYIGPFRADPQRTYRDSEINVHDVGVRGENTSMLLKQASQEHSKLLDHVSFWFQNAMGYRLDIDDVGPGLYRLVMQNDAGKDNIIDVGYGVSQVIPIVTQLYDTTKSHHGTIAVEQPEIHLHPAAQSLLADLFVECIDKKSVSSVNRIMIETHSEHLIRRLQVLVADPHVDFKEDQIAIYYVDKDTDGCSSVKKMELLPNGQFKTAWPSGFFDKSYELSRQLLSANSRR